VTANALRGLLSLASRPAPGTKRRGACSLTTAKGKVSGTSPASHSVVDFEWFDRTASHRNGARHQIGPADAPGNSGFAAQFRAGRSHRLPARAAVRAKTHRQRVIVTPGEQEPDTLCGMEQRLVAAGQRRANALALGRRSPIRGGSNGAVMCGKADQYCIMAIFSRVSWPTLSSEPLTHTVARASPR